MQKKPELRFHVYEVPGAVRLAETESRRWEPGLDRGWEVSVHADRASVGKMKSVDGGGAVQERACARCPWTTHLQIVTMGNCVTYILPQ